MPGLQDEQHSALRPEGGFAQHPILWAVPARSALFTLPAPNDVAARKASANGSDDVSLLMQQLGTAGLSAVQRMFSAIEIRRQSLPLVAFLRGELHSGSNAAVEAGLVLAASEFPGLLAERHHPPRQVPMDSFAGRFAGHGLLPF